MFREQELDPIANRKRLEDVNQNFDKLRAEAKRRQRTFEGIPLDAAGNPILHTTLLDKDGNRKELPYSTASRTQPEANVAELYWGLDAVPLEFYTESIEDAKRLEAELKDLERHAREWALAMEVNHNGQ